MARRQSKRQSIKNILGLLLMMVFVLIILLPPPVILTVPAIKRKIGELNNELIFIGSDRQLEMRLFYDDVITKGWGLARNVIVVNPRLQLIETDDDGKETVTRIKTSQLHIAAQKNTPTALKVLLNEPLVMEEEGVELLKVSFNESPHYLLSTEKEEQETVYKHQFFIPGEILLLLPQKNDSSDEVATIKIKLDAYPKMELLYYPQKKLQKSDYKFTNVLIEEPEAQIGLAEIEAHFNKEFTGENQISSSYQYSFRDFTTPELIESLGPISGKVEFSYTGEADARLLSDAPRTGINELMLKNAVLTSKTLTAQVNGVIKRSGDDQYPYGRLEFTLSNLQSAMDKGLLDAEQHALWTLAMQKITSQPSETFDNATFSFSREKNGEFLLGAASLQEIVGLVTGKFFPAANFIPPNPTQELE